MRLRWTFGLLAVAGLALSSGCDNKPGTPDPAAEQTKPPADKTPGKKDHDHGAGPHGGVVGDLGGKYHFEFTVSHPKQEATIYILGGDAKKMAPIKADTLTLSIFKPKFRVELKPVPQEGDPAGTSSRFVGKHEKLGVEQEFAGEVSVEMEGKSLSGEFEEKPEKK